MSLPGFFLNLLSSLAAIGVLYGLYVVSARHARRCVAQAECWWLPRANTFRFVIRNMPRKGNLFNIRYRAWTRKYVPASEGISVRTFVDSCLADGERLLLPGGQDFPVICFRLQTTGPDLNLVSTDKMGTPLEIRAVDDESFRLMIEFSARTRTWLLFKHEIFRLYAVPQFRQIGGCRRDVFQEYLLPMQRSQEQQMQSVMQYAQEVTVTI